MLHGQTCFDRIYHLHPHKYHQDLLLEEAMPVRLDPLSRSTDLLADSHLDNDSQGVIAIGANMQLTSINQPPDNRSRSWRYSPIPR